MVDGPVHYKRGEILLTILIGHPLTRSTSQHHPPEPLAKCLALIDTCSYSLIGTLSFQTTTRQSIRQRGASSLEKTEDFRQFLLIDLENLWGYGWLWRFSLKWDDLIYPFILFNTSQVIQCKVYKEGQRTISCPGSSQQPPINPVLLKGQNIGWPPVPTSYLDQTSGPLRV